MQVYFYTGRMTHPFYREQMSHPPDGVSYVRAPGQLHTSEYSKAAFLSDQWTSQVLRRAKVTGLAILAHAGIPQFRHLRLPPCQLVHSRHLLLNRFPWVADVEDVTAFTWYHRSVLDRPWARHWLEGLLASPYCRMILPWTEASRRSLENGLSLDTRIRKKIRVIYPAIAPASFDSAGKARKRTVDILFVSSGLRDVTFYLKGGMEMLLAFERVSRRYQHTSLAMVAYVPPAIKDRFACNERIRFLPWLSSAQLEEEYARADLLIAPTHLDTLGYVYFEAFAHGVPCVGLRHFAVPEIITEGVTGLLVDTEHSYFGPDCLPRYPPPRYDNHPLVEYLKFPPEKEVDELAEKISMLIEDRDLRLQMSAAAYEEVSQGRFSVPRRHQTLSLAYQEALDGIC